MEENYIVVENLCKSFSQKKSELLLKIADLTKQLSIVETFLTEIQIPVI